MNFIELKEQAKILETKYNEKNSRTEAKRKEVQAAILNAIESHSCRAMIQDLGRCQHWTFKFECQPVPSQCKHVFSEYGEWYFLDETSRRWGPYSSRQGAEDNFKEYCKWL